MYCNVNHSFFYINFVRQLLDEGGGDDGLNSVGQCPCNGMVCTTGYNG